MRKASIRVSNLCRAGMMCASVGCALACSSQPPVSDGHHLTSAPAPTATASASPATVAPPAAAPKPTSPLFYFYGQVDVQKQQISMTYESVASHDAHLGKIITEVNLNEGTGSNEVVAHTMPGSVAYDTGGGACGFTGTPLLCAKVDIWSFYSGGLRDVTATITSTTPSSVTSTGPYLYGYIMGTTAGGGSSDFNCVSPACSPSDTFLRWTFIDGAQTSFTFSGVMSASVVCPVCSGPTPTTFTPICSPTGACVACETDTECANEYGGGCQNGECSN